MRLNCTEIVFLFKHFNVVYYVKYVKYQLDAVG